MNNIYIKKDNLFKVERDEFNDYQYHVFLLDSPKFNGYGFKIPSFCVSSSSKNPMNFILNFSKLNKIDIVKYKKDNNELNKKFKRHKISTNELIELIDQSIVHLEYTTGKYLLYYYKKRNSGEYKCESIESEYREMIKTHDKYECGQDVTVVGTTDLELDKVKEIVSTFNDILKFDEWTIYRKIKFNENELDILVDHNKIKLIYNEHITLIENLFKTISLNFNLETDIEVLMKELQFDKLLTNYQRQLLESKIVKWSYFRVNKDTLRVEYFVEHDWYDNVTTTKLKEVSKLNYSVYPPSNYFHGFPSSKIKQFFEKEKQIYNELISSGTFSKVKYSRKLNLLACELIDNELKKLNK